MVSITVHNYGDEEVTVTLSLVLPPAAPSGDYLCQGMILTALPSEDGYCLEYAETIVTKP